MTLRPPRMNSSKVRESALGYEIAQEQAAALGRLGRALDAALSEHDGLLQSRCGDHPGQAPAASACCATPATPCGALSFSVKP